MGVLAWLRRRKDSPEDGTLIRDRYDDPKLAEVERNAAADIAAVESNDKYFDPDSPGQKDGE